MSPTSLTPSQLEAVEYGSGPLIVVAGPGTGKTLTLIHRLLFLLESGRAKPSQILAVTFTQKAAQELQSRLARLGKAGRESGSPWITTFHGFCLHFLKNHLSAEFTLLSEAEALTLLRKTLAQDYPDFPPRYLRELARRISLAKNHLVPPEAASSLHPWSDHPEWPFYYRSYQQQLVRGRFWDFDDLLWETVSLLEQSPDLLSEQKRRFPFVLIDEFQDINPAQYRLFQLLTEPSGTWMVIGDPNQAIYGFRGSCPEFFSRLAQDRPRAKMITLHQSFRLNRTVLTAAAQVLSSRAVPLQTDQPGPPGLPLIEQATSEAEAETIADYIQQAVGGMHLSYGGGQGPKPGPLRSFADFAVLYRLHAQGEELAKAFVRRGIPFQKVGETHWAESPEVRALLRSLKGSTVFFSNPLEAVETALAQLSFPSNTPSEGIEALNQLRRSAATFSGTLEEFLENLFLQTALDLYQPDRESVTLMTLHAAKGLEFPVVFLAGCEAELLPLTGWGESDPEEERRLFYVGMTRARGELLLTWVRKRTLFGQSRFHTLSPFVQDIDPSLVIPTPSGAPPKKKKGRSQLNLFPR